MFVKDKLYDVHHMVYNLLPEGTDKLLDLGCQKADCTKFFVNKARLVVGLDYQKTFLLEAGTLSSEVKLVNSRIEHLPFQDGAFDYVIMTEMLGCVLNATHCIKEICRVLKVGGKLILSAPQRGLFHFLDPDNFKFYFPSVYYKIYCALKKRPPAKSIRFSKKDDYYPHYSLEEIKSLLNSRFTICKVHRGGFLIYPISIWINYFFNTLFLNTRLLKLINYLSDKEYRINFGKLAYNLLVVAEKV